MCVSLCVCVFVQFDWYGQVVIFSQYEVYNTRGLETRAMLKS